VLRPKPDQPHFVRDAYTHTSRKVPLGHYRLLWEVGPMSGGCESRSSRSPLPGAESESEIEIEIEIKRRASEGEVCKSL